MATAIRVHEAVEADQGTRERQERLVDVIPTIIPELEVAVLMQPTLRTLDYPTVHAQAAAMGCSSLGQQWLAPAPPQLASMRLGVIRAVALDAIEPSPRMAAFAAHRRNGIEQRQQLRHVVAVCFRERDRHRRPPLAIDQQVVFRPWFSAVHRARSRFFPPCIARTLVESTTARDQSILSAAFSRSSSTRCRFFQTPACCQSRSRRQQVMPQPQPSSCGSDSHGRPVLRTKTTPVSTLRSSSGGRPPRRVLFRRRGNGGGSSGSMISQSSSVTNGWAIVTSL